MVKKIALINGRIITPYRVLDGYTLYSEDGVIRSIEKNSQIPDGYDVFDCNGDYISPGFIDLHLHGGGGYDFMDGTKEALIGSVMTHMKHGTTSLYPTTLTCTNEELFNFLDLYKKVKQEIKNGPNLMGVHLEGPFFSYNQRGAQDSRYLQEITKENYLKILNASDDIKRMSVAVELSGSTDLGSELRKRKIVAAIGHTDASYNEAVLALENGYSLVTHLYSGMQGVHRINAYRHLGMIESAFLLDSMDVEIIADGRHLPIELLKFIIKNKPIDHVCLITDSSRGAGLPNGTKMKLGSIDNGVDAIIKDDVAFLASGDCFAGSVCTTDRCVRTLYKEVGVSIEQAIQMITTNPARVMKIDDRKGKIAVGMDSDFCIFDDSINIHHVVVGGEIRF